MNAIQRACPHVWGVGDSETFRCRRCYVTAPKAIVRVAMADSRWKYGLTDEAAKALGLSEEELNRIAPTKPGGKRV